MSVARHRVPNNNNNQNSLTFKVVAPVSARRDFPAAYQYASSRREVRVHTEQVCRCITSSFSFAIFRRLLSHLIGLSSTSRSLYPRSIISPIESYQRECQCHDEVARMLDREAEMEDDSTQTAIHHVFPRCVRSFINLAFNIAARSRYNRILMRILREKYCYIQ